MTFLHPLALFALAAAAIPALLHLLERRTPPELEFPPLRYLTDAERRSARRLRLRHLLLLLLRTSLIVVVVLAAARPLVPTPGGEGGAHAPTALAVILDNSPSAGAVVGGRPVLERIRAAARGSLAQATVADRVWLVLADGAIRAGSRDALIAAVDGAGLDARRLDLTAAVGRAARVVDAEPLAAREVHVASDLQRTALESDGRALVPTGVRVLALAPAEPPPNRGLARVRVRDGAAVIEAVGTRDAPPGAVTVIWRGVEAGRAMIMPGGTAALTLPSAPPGWWTGEARLDPDELRADDARPFVWRVAPPARVTAGADAGLFVAAALEVLREGGRIAAGRDVAIGERPGGAGGGAGTTIVLPPADPALVGQANRALAARGGRWRFGAPGPPGPLDRAALAIVSGVPVARRLRLEGPADDTAAVLATVQGEPWLVRDPAAGVILLGSRLDTAWTGLPTGPGFVPFVDALVNRVTRGEATVTDVEGTPGVAFEIRGTDTVGATVSGPDPRESDLSPASAAVVRVALGGQAQVLDAPRFAAERFAGTRRADASGALLALALLLAAAELAVATRTR